MGVSESPSASPSVSPSVSPSASRSPSTSPSKSPSASPSASPSRSPSASPSVSPSPLPSYRNNFKSDYRIISVWRFENNLNDDKGGNHLTASAGGVSYDTGTPIEGAASLVVVNSSNQWASRTDATLSADFPLRSTDTNRLVSWSLWIQPTNIGSGVRYVITKFSYTVKQTLSIHQDTANLVIGYATGNTSGTVQWWSPVTDLVAGQWYHIGLAVNGNTGVALLQFYRQQTDTATTYNNTFTGTLNLTDVAFVVGNRGNLDTSYDFYGKIDEVVVANTTLTADDFDAIRLGTFNVWTGDEMYSTLYMTYPQFGTVRYRPFLVL